MHQRIKFILSWNGILHLWEKNPRKCIQYFLIVVLFTFCTRCILGYLVCIFVSCLVSVVVVVVYCCSCLVSIVVVVFL